MSTERVIACEYYVNEGTCSKGKECAFWGHCQKCKYYRAKKGGKPVRTNTRGSKMERINRKETRREYGI